MCTYQARLRVLCSFNYCPIVFLKGFAETLKAFLRESDKETAGKTPPQGLREASPPYCRARGHGKQAMIDGYFVLIAPKSPVNAAFSTPFMYLSMSPSSGSRGTGIFSNFIFS